MQEQLVAAPVVGAVYLKMAVLAETPAIDPGVGSLVGNLGVVGFLIWFAWHQTKYGVPEMTRAFATEQQRQRDAHEAAIEKLRETFETQQAELRAAFDREMRLVREHSEKEREHSAKQMEALRQMLMESMRSMRTAVHDVRDTANTAIQKSAAAEIQARKEKGDSDHGERKTPKLPDPR